MRKQIARVALSTAMLPLTITILNGLSEPGTHAGTSGGSTNPQHALGANAELASLSRLRLTGAAAGAGQNFTASTVGKVARQASSASSTAAPLSAVSAAVANAGHQVYSSAQALILQARNASYLAKVSQANAAAAARVAAAYKAPAPAPVAYQAPPASMTSILACIRHYESGGNYGDTANPYYRGAYQFSYSTWASVGGAGDPAAASPAEQDMRAAMLAQRSGWGQWSTAPLCGV